MKNQLRLSNTDEEVIMTLSEQDKKRRKDLANQLEIVQSKIKRLLSYKEGEQKVILTTKQSKELFKLIDHEKELLEEFTSIKGINHD